MFKLKTGPLNTPVTLAEIKESLIIDFTEDDALLTALIDAATRHTEEYLGTPLISQVWERYSNSFHNVGLMSNLISVDSVTYRDTSENLQTLTPATYTALIKREVGSLGLSQGYSWPSYSTRYEPITITFTTGYGALASDVPTPIRLAIKLLVGHLYNNRSATDTLTIKEVPLAYQALLGPFKVQVV